MSLQNMKLPNLASMIGTDDLSSTLSEMYCFVNNKLFNAYKKAIINNEFESFTELFGTFPHLFDGDIHEDRDIDTDLGELIYKYKRFEMFDHIIVYALHREISMFYYNLMMTLENQSVYEGNEESGWRDFLMTSPFTFMINNCFVPELEMFKQNFTDSDIPDDESGKVYFHIFINGLENAIKARSAKE